MLEARTTGSFTGTPVAFPRGSRVNKCRGTKPRAIRSSKITAMFNIFGTKRQVAGKGRQQELIEKLLLNTNNVDGGFRVSPQQREDIASIVQELQRFSIKDPLGSDFIFGRWEVRYASKPQTAGGPFRTPVGRIVFPGQTAIQLIEEPNICINEIQFKTLGFIPGSVTQEGTVEPVDGNTFEITFTTNTGKRIGGPPKRLIEIIYLDENIRIAQAIPMDSSQEPGFYVFTREGVEFDVEAPEATTPVPQWKSRGTQVSSGTQKQDLELLATQKAQAKEQYDELSEEYKALFAESQEMNKELAALERESSKATRGASSARKLVEKSEVDAMSLNSELAELQAAEVELEKSILASQRELNLVRQTLMATKRSIGPKLK